jgi:N-acetylglucosaminyl-diphospho-decaprenol L-rhamnosyltransferase
MASYPSEQVVETVQGNRKCPIELSVIIVNWNSTDYLLKAIASIEAETQSMAYEVVVIDSGSFDGCDEVLRQAYPHVLFVQSDRNLGFAKANNAAFNISKGRNILFLNPDTEIEGHAIDVLHSNLNSLPNAGIVGAKLLNSDRSIQESCIRAFPTILNQVVDSNTLRQLFPGAGLWGMKPIFVKNDAAKTVDAVSGACLMIKRSVFENVAMFSTDYFMYSEDIDLCLKAQLIGLSTYYVPTAIVVHHGGRSSSQARSNTFSAVMLLESRWRFFRKTRSLSYARLYRLAIFGASIFRIGLVLFAWPIRRLCVKEFNDGVTLKKWIARLRWSLGGERWAKNYQP